MKNFKSLWLACSAAVTSGLLGMAPYAIADEVTEPQLTRKADFSSADVKGERVNPSFQMIETHSRPQFKCTELLSQPDSYSKCMGLSSDSPKVEAGKMTSKLPLELLSKKREPRHSELSGFRLNEQSPIRVKGSVQGLVGADPSGKPVPGIRLEGEAGVPLDSIKFSDPTSRLELKLLPIDFKVGTKLDLGFYPGYLNTRDFKAHIKLLDLAKAELKLGARDEEEFYRGRMASAMNLYASLGGAEAESELVNPVGIDRRGLKSELGSVGYSIRARLDDFHFKSQIDLGIIGRFGHVRKGEALTDNELGGFVSAMLGADIPQVGEFDLKYRKEESSPIVNNTENPITDVHHSVNLTGLFGPKRMMGVTAGYEFRGSEGVKGQAAEMHTGTVGFMIKN